MEWRPEERRQLDHAIDDLNRLKLMLHKRGKWRWEWKIGDALEVIRVMERERLQEILEEGGQPTSYVSMVSRSRLPEI
jgi:hypothetical protein